MGGGSVCQKANGYSHNHALVCANSNGLSRGGYTLPILYAIARTKRYFHSDGHKHSDRDPHSHANSHRNANPHCESDRNHYPNLDTSAQQYTYTNDFSEASGNQYTYPNCILHANGFA